METSPFVVYLISLLCCLYTILMAKFLLDTVTVIQSNASNSVNLDKSNALN